MIVVLDNIRSAHNVGSIFRTADAFGVEKLFLCGVTPGPLDRFGRNNPKVTKVSLGAEKTMPFEHTSETEQAINNLKTRGFIIVAIEQSSTSQTPEAITKLVKNKQIAIVLGSEVPGLSENVLTLADYIMEIPMRGEKESLNVSVAAGIALYALTVDI